MPLKFSAVAIMQASPGDSRLWSKHDRTTTSLVSSQLRIANGLSQRQLAQLIGTTASVICRLEDANYEGHSLAMLNRIAAALNQRVEIRFVPAERRLRSA
jgi:DNA-binding XRE family transcriptional regulator